ncbi:MAG: hypothetical protein HETSPECPRED_007373 [Heterodermia speciosa]|uniref:Solute carrier family 40 member n=1 Tax=Heterodermia speciosa TaxID=116794 RepID=A0A8H3IV99_9LECA|nr:MAG: hypothetical protein HETSPECPRED_007373 [Heterodermia speciosa]
MAMVEYESLKIGLLSVLCILACVEKVYSVMNLIAVERDWVIVIADDIKLDLQSLNSQIRRIDLASKLLGPLAIALLDGISTRDAIYATMGLSICSVTLEYYTVAKVYHQVPALSGFRQIDAVQHSNGDVPIATRLRSYGLAAWRGLSRYIHHEVFLPSLALSITHLTVLSFSGQMVTYLFSMGFSSASVGLMRTASVVLEMSATWVAPWAMSKVGPLRAGLWSINEQILLLVGAVIAFWIVKSPSMSALSLVVGVVLSRVGLWGFDLSVQILVQEGVDLEVRGTFSSIEVSFQNFFELWAYASTIVFSRPAQFRYPAVMSVIAVIIAGAIYAGYSRGRRGHLMHLSPCIEGGRQRLIKQPDGAISIRMRDL